VIVPTARIPEWHGLIPLFLTVTQATRKQTQLAARFLDAGVPDDEQISIWTFDQRWIMIVLSSAGSGLIRGKLACNHCAQGKLGCPTAALFSGKQDQAPCPP
jgi:hypothetical protein